MSQFREQQSKLIETLRHLNTVTKGREVNYSLIAFHRLSVTLTSLNEQSGLNKVIFFVKFRGFYGYYFEEFCIKCCNLIKRELKVERKKC